MRLYWAAIVAFVAVLVWPEQNMAEVPFAELTIKLIATTVMALWLAYHSLKLAFGSIEKDEFWPWRWTKPIVKMLALRVGWIMGFFVILWIVQLTKLGPWMDEYPMVVLIIGFLVITFAVCADDASIRGDDPVAAPVYQSDDQAASDK